jgi:hypothetical protein
MRHGVLASLRKMRRCLAQAVMLAIVLPALIGLLPQPALSASSALERDLMLSVCGQDVPQQPGGAPQHQAHEHCVLCASPCHSFGPSLAAAAPAFAAPPRDAEIAVADQRAVIASPLQALIDASPPRGPPSHS